MHKVPIFTLQGKKEFLTNTRLFSQLANSNGCHGAQQRNSVSNRKTMWLLNNTEYVVGLDTGDDVKDGWRDNCSHSLHKEFTGKFFFFFFHIQIVGHAVINLQSGRHDEATGN